MSILSDSTLKDEIAKGRLILDGDPGAVRYCAYRFTAEKIFVPGTSAPILDWTIPPPNAVYVVEPGALVWMRTKGIVRMPANLCAFYWQTNHLSRSGLMLVNASMVEPGYEGSLACVFANFGKLPVPIYPTTTVAKLFFLELDQAAAQALDQIIEVEDYDRGLKDVAIHAPASFLQISEMTLALSEERDAAVETVNRAAQEAKTAQWKDLEKDFEGKLRRTVIGGAAAFVALVALINVFALVQSKIRPNIEAEIQDRVTLEVRRRAATEAGAIAARRDSLDAASQSEVRALRRALDSVAARVRLVERRR
jgi:deoxycytidine triphosphate deaminase